MSSAKVAVRSLCTIRLRPAPSLTARSLCRGSHRAHALVPRRSHQIKAPQRCSYHAVTGSFAASRPGIGISNRPSYRRLSSLPDGSAAPAAASSLWKQVKSSVEATRLRGVAAEKGVEELVRIMRDRSDDVVLTAEGCRALLGMTFEAKMQAEVVRGGGTAALVRALQTHGSSDVNITLLAVVALQHLTTQPTLRPALVQSGVVASLLDAEQAHVSDPTVAIPVWRAMTNIAMDPELVQRIVLDGGASAALSSMARHAEDVHVAEAALAVIAASADSEADRLVDAGAVETTLQCLAMACRSTDERSAYATSNALFALARICSFCASAPGRASESAAARTIMSAMAHYPEEADIQARSGMALWCIFTAAENVIEADACGALATLVGSMRNWKESSDVQLWGVHALSRAVLHAPEAVLRVGAASVCDELLAKCSSGHYLPEHRASLTECARLVGSVAGRSL